MSPSIQMITEMRLGICYITAFLKQTVLFYVIAT